MRARGLRVIDNLLTQRIACTFFGFTSVFVNFSRNYKSVEEERQSAWDTRSKQGSWELLIHSQTATQRNTVSSCNFDRHSERKK